MNKTHIELTIDVVNNLINNSNISINDVEKITNTIKNIYDTIEEIDNNK